MYDIDIVVDIETLGLSPVSSPLIQIGAIAVFGTAVHTNVFDMCAEEVEGASHGTVKWWRETNPELLSDILQRGTGNSEKMLVTKFVEWMESFGGNIRLWGKGPSFDNEFLKAKAMKYDVEWPLSHTQDMCIRTVFQFHKELNLPEPGFVGIKHNALNDALYEADKLIQVRKELTKNARKK